MGFDSEYHEFLADEMRSMRSVLLTTASVDIVLLSIVYPQRALLD
jgi:hypothetical protein